MVRLIYIRSRDANTVYGPCGMRISLLLYYMNYNNIIYYFGKQSVLQQHPALCVVRSTARGNAVQLMNCKYCIHHVYKTKHRDNTIYKIYFSSRSSRILNGTGNNNNDNTTTVILSQRVCHERGLAACIAAVQRCNENIYDWHPRFYTVNLVHCIMCI